MANPITPRTFETIASRDGKRELSRRILRYHERADDLRDEMAGLSPDNPRWTELKDAFDWIWEKRNELAEEFRNWGKGQRTP